MPSAGVVRRRILVSILLAVAVVATLAIRLGRPQLHPDEITYLSVVYESMAQGTVFPVEGTGELFLNKPPLAFWLMRGAFELMGPTPFAGRLPSVLATATAAVVVYLVGAAFVGEGVGILASLLFAFNPGALRVHGLRSATPDALEILLVAAAIAALELWRRRHGWALGCVVALVAATAWVKSPFALVVFVVVLAATEIPARRAGFGTPRLPLTLGLTLAAWTASWMLWLAVLSSGRTPEAVAQRLLVEQYANRLEGKLKHLEGPTFYLESVVSDFGPLLLLPLLALAAYGVSVRWRGRPVDRPSPYALACFLTWALAAPVLATFSAAKLPWYAYLSYPGIALLLAASAGAVAAAVSDRRRVQRAVFAVFGIASLAIHAVRIPSHFVWPAESAFRGLPGRLWEIARRDPEIGVVTGPPLRLSRGRDNVYREARFYLRTLSWSEARRRVAVAPTCRAVLVNDRRDAAAVAGIARDAEMVELYRPERSRDGIGLWLIDDCDGRLARELAGEADPVSRVR